MLPGTGNSVAEIKETKMVCQNCEGDGSLFIRKEELRKHLEYMQFNCMRNLLKEYHTLKANNWTIDCPDCNGAGYWIARD